MTWRETSRDDRYRVPFVTYKCSHCGKQAVTTGWGMPSKCVCTRLSAEFEDEERTNPTVVMP